MIDKLKKFFYVVPVAVIGAWTINEEVNDSFVPIFYGIFALPGLAVLMTYYGIKNLDEEA